MQTIMEGNDGERVVYLSAEVVLVLENGVVVSVHTNSIGEHLLLVIEKSVSAEIVGEVDALVNDSGATAIYAGRSIAGDAGRRASHFTHSTDQTKKEAGPLGFDT